VRYYQQHYSAERMTLVILGAEPLDVLQSWAADLFSAVPSGRGCRPTFEHAGPPFKVKNYKKKLIISNLMCRTTFEHAGPPF
jgi:secreted Zn-dependent insulinase-like peptidase